MIFVLAFFDPAEIKEATLLASHSSTMVHNATFIKNCFVVQYFST
jgi:hypothetical protein